MYKPSMFNVEKVVSGDCIIYNSLTKAVLKANQESLSNLINDMNNGTIDDQVIINDIVDNGFAIDKNENEIDALQYVFQKKYFDSSELNIILVPTMA